MPETFSAKIAAFTAGTQQRLVEVSHEAALLIDREVSRPEQEGGNLPVVSGNLRRSRAASTIGMPSVLWRQKEFNGSDAAIAAVINGAPLGASIWIGFQAPYAIKIEDKKGFVRLAAQRWPQVVEEAVRNVVGRSGGAA